MQQWIINYPLTKTICRTTHDTAVTLTGPRLLATVRAESPLFVRFSAWRNPDDIGFGLGGNMKKIGLFLILWLAAAASAQQADPSPAGGGGSFGTRGIRG